MDADVLGRTHPGTHGEFDWPIVEEELHGFIVDTLRDAGMFLYGRRVYEMMAGYWPSADEDPHSNRFQVEYSKIWKAMPKLVFSHTLGEADWNTSVVRDVDEGIREYAGTTDGDLYLFGGAEIVSAFARQDLIDEYQIFVHPVLLGGGSPLFPHLDGRQSMALREARTFDEKVAGLRYARAR